MNEKNKETLDALFSDGSSPAPANPQNQTNQNQPQTELNKLKNNFNNLLHEQGFWDTQKGLISQEKNSENPQEQTPNISGLKTDNYLDFNEKQDFSIDTKHIPPSFLPLIEKANICSFTSKEIKELLRLPNSILFKLTSLLSISEMHGSNLNIFNKLLEYYRAFNQSKYELTKHIEREIGTKKKCCIHDVKLKEANYKLELKNWNFGLLTNNWIMKGVDWDAIKKKLTKVRKKYAYQGLIEGKNYHIDGAVVSLSGSIKTSKELVFILHSYLGFYVFNNVLYIAYMAQTNKKQDLVILHVLMGG